MENITHKIRLKIEAIKRNESLHVERNFCQRADALDYLEFDVIERIEALVFTNGQSGELLNLGQDAEVLKRQLEVIDERLFQELRKNIAAGNYTPTGLMGQLTEYAGLCRSENEADDEAYDCLDALTNGFLLGEAAPEETRPREPEMVFYQPTPTRIILELVEKAHFEPEDVFYDIGSGLGQASILVHLLSGVQTIGVEFEPTYCDYARHCAMALNLSQVKFINADARFADYSEGTVFFMYTPVEGKMLQQVLTKLRDDSPRRSIRLYTYGPCTIQVARQQWLARMDQNGDRVHKLAVFRSI